MSLETPRLVIREFEMTDWPAVYQYSSDIEVMKYVIYRASTEPETQAFIQRAIAGIGQTPRMVYERAVVLRHAPGTLIGGCGISLANETIREWGIGYCYHPSYWGKGYGTEVVRALLAFGFITLGAHRIFARCDADNKASARVLEKGGMRQEGHFREKVWGIEQWRDELEYAILDHEWQPQEKKRILMDEGRP